MSNLDDTQTACDDGTCGLCRTCAPAGLPPHTPDFGAPGDPKYWCERCRIEAQAATAGLPTREDFALALSRYGHAFALGDNAELNDARDAVCRVFDATARLAMEAQQDAAWWRKTFDKYQATTEAKLAELREQLRLANIDAALAEAEGNAREPRGCPTPGACSCPAVRAEAQQDRERLDAVLSRALARMDDINPADEVAWSDVQHSIVDARRILFAAYAERPTGGTE